MTQCSTCGNSNPAGFSFCGYCGSALGLSCPRCGAEVPAGMRFCGKCGADVSSASPAAVTQAPIAERRVVSVLFADLVGFTSASASRDAEDVRELLARYFEIARKLVELYGGQVEKFIGDAIFAVWGTPTANEDDAERAVRTGLDLVTAIESLGEEVGLPELRARAGVMTGEAAVTLGATGQGMVAGDLVNTASRLQALAPAGSLLADVATRRLTDAAVIYEDFGAHDVKGKEEPLQAYRALRVVAARGGAQRAAGLEPPFVGRERELRVLKELFHAADDEARARLVAVTGIAGIGKSRLAWEFFKYIDGVAGTVLWHAGRCLAYGDGVTYWALAEMVRSRAGILEGEGGDDALAKLRQVLETYVSDAEERNWLEMRLAQLIGLAEPGQGDRQDLFAAWRRFFERLAERYPTVLLFEDMQWADPSLIEFVDYLLEWSRDSRIFVVTLGRAGDDAVRSARGQSALHLDPLSRSVMESMIVAAVPGLPAPLLAQIVERAEGVPLYAVETIRMLLDRGLLVPDGPAYKVAGPITELEVPVSLHTLVASRLDGLNSTERLLVQEAAVLGKTFTAAGLAAVSGREVGEIQRALDSLLRKEILTVRADPRSPERGQYAFLQDVVRQVAYGTLAKRDRREAHLRVAAYLEQSFADDPDEIVEVLAAHLVDAYQQMPEADDAEVLRVKARGLLARAGEHAASLGAVEVAQGYFDRAAQLSGNDWERADADLRAGQMAWRRGLVDAAVSRFERSRAGFESEGDEQRAALAQASLAETFIFRGHLRTGADQLSAAYEKIAGREADETTAILAASLGRMLMLLDDPAAALPYLEIALKAAEDLQLTEVFSQALNTKGTVLTIHGRQQEAALLLRHALEVARAGRHWPAAFRAYNNLGVVYYNTDAFREGIELFTEAVAEARRLGNSNETANTLSSQIGYNFWLGRWDDALARMREVQEAAGPELLKTPWLVTRFADAMVVLCNRGELDEARRLLDSVKDSLTTDQGDVQVQIGAVLTAIPAAEGRHAEVLAALRPLLVDSKIPLTHPSSKTALPMALEAALQVGDLEAADNLLAPALSAKPGQSPPSLLGLRARYIARIAAARGQEDGVEANFRAAIAAYAQGEITFYRAVVKLELAEWLIERGRSSEAGPVLTEARAAFAELKAAPWLARAARLHVTTATPA